MTELSLDDLIKIVKNHSNIPEADKDFSHITYDENLRDGVIFAQGMQHDGTLTHTIDLILRMMVPLLYKDAKHKGMTHLNVLGYKIGKLKLEDVECPQSEKCFKFMHTHERASLPIEIIYDDRPQ